MQREEILQLIKNHLVKPQHTILIGARQVGKTTLVGQLMAHLQQNKNACILLQAFFI